MAGGTMAGAPAGADQLAAGGDNEAQETFTVCISALSDGTFKVYAQDSDDDQDDGAAAGAGGMGQPAPAEGSDGSDGQIAATMDEAMQMASQMLQEEAGEDAGEGQDDGSADGNAPVADPKAVWNQLAKKSDKSRGI